MKVTRLGNPRPVLTSGLGDSYSFVPSGGTSGQTLTSNGSNGRYWGENVARISANGSNALIGPFVSIASGSNTILSVASNTLTIATTGTGGSSTFLTANGSNSLSGTVNLQAGTGIALGVSGQTITVTNIGSGSGGSSGALVLLEQKTASASAQLDFTTFISSTYDTYLFKFVGIIPATSTALLYMRMGTGAGPTYDTGANYGSQLFRHSFNASALSGADSAAVQIVLTTAWLSTGVHPIAGSLELYDPGSTALNKYVSAKFVYPDSTLGNMAVSEVGGQYNSTTAVTAVRFFMSSGNITSGTIRVYGLTK